MGYYFCVFGNFVEMRKTMQRLIGIDIIENNRIKLDLVFLTKFLTNSEIEILDSFDSKQRKIQFCAGRWAVKEAIYKSLPKTLQLPLNKIEIGYIEERPFVLNSNLKNMSISLSHENNYSVAIAIWWGEF